MEQKINQFLHYLEHKKDQSIREEQYLISEERKDDANICRIRMNIYELCGRMFESTAEQAKASGEDFSDIGRHFEEMIQPMTENWGISYEAAKKYQDVEKILIEEVKLAAAAEVKEVFERIKGGETV